MQFGLTFKDIQPGGSYLSRRQRFGQRCIVNDAAARDVHQRSGRLHHGEFRRAYGVVRFFAVGQHQHHVICLLQQLLFADVSSFASGLVCCAETAAVVINDTHIETVRAAFGYRLAYAPHAYDAQGAAMHRHARKRLKRPLLPMAFAYVAFAFGHSAGSSHQQRKPEVSRGLGQHIRRVGGQHLVSRHGRHVKVVIAHGQIGAHAQTRAGGQHRFIHRFYAHGQRSVMLTQRLGPALYAPFRVDLVSRDFKINF